MYIEWCLHDDCGLILQRLLIIYLWTIIIVIISKFEVRNFVVRKDLRVMIEDGEAVLDAGVAERVATVRQQNWHAFTLIVNLGAKSALNFFHVNY
jgi:hypothetical protein